MFQSSGIFISSEMLKALPERVRQTLISHVLSTADGSTSTSIDEPSSFSENIVELSPSQARALLDGLYNPKTRKAVEFIARGKSRVFQVAELAKSLGEKPSALSGVWSGITRRARTVSGERLAKLIDWHQPPIFKGDEYVDQRAEVAEMTHRSLRTALRL
jgi:hypothetical protein